MVPKDRAKTSQSKGAPDPLMISTLAADRSSFRVANLHELAHLQAIGVLNLTLFAHNRLRPEQTRGSQGLSTAWDSVRGT